MNAELQAMIERGRQAAEKRKRQDELDAIAQRETDKQAYRALLDRAGLSEWMNEYLSHDGYRTERYSLTLPGCALIDFRIDRQWNGVFWEVLYNARVYEPRRVHFDNKAEEWRIDNSTVIALPRTDSLDEAIALAADLGESWHAMKAEAERRNAEGLRPQPPTPAQPEPKPEPDALTRIAVALERIADRLDGFSDNLAEDALRVNVLR